MFAGSYVAIVTPFKNGKVDEPKLRELIEWHVESGTNGIVPCGTTGESATLSHKEHDLVVNVTVDQVKKRAKVLAGTGSNSTSEAIRITQHAKDAGVDGALLITPYYNKPPQEGLYQHFKAVAQAVDIPIVLYNVPGRTAVNTLPETVKRCSEINNIVGIKEASGDLNQISEVIRLCGPDFHLLSGEDAQNFSILSLGGKGVISVTANCSPLKMALLCQSCQKGNLEEARQIHDELAELHQAMFFETNPIPVKTALALMGKINEEFRLPLVPMAEKNRQHLKAVLKKYKLI